jgi:NADPH:quinone reductase-like Zn-dependent oxidoreductase
MKAAVIYPGSGLPAYVDLPEPVAGNEDELVVSVKAVAVKHLDRSQASGKHYTQTAPSGEGKVIGGDGVCLLPDGTRVYAIGITGMLAEKAIISRDRIVPLPEGIDDVTAAALPNAVIGAAMALRFKADIRSGDVVLINGATGFTGRVAVQLARHYGAKSVIATGRNPQSLQDLLSLGADEVISMTPGDEDFKARIAEAHGQTPIDVVIDYLWGHSAELILGCLKGNGSFANKIRYVSVGSVTGDTIQLSAAVLRSIDLQLSGSGMGAWSRSQVKELFTVILPEAFRLAVEGKLKIATTTAVLKDIADLWNKTIPDGRRLVVTIG